MIRTKLGRWLARPRVTPVVAGLVGLLVVLAVVVVSPRAGREPSMGAGATATAPSPTSATPTSATPTSATPTSATPTPTTATPTPSVPRPNGGNTVTGPRTWWSWALVDRQTGATWGGPTADEPTRSVSMIKFWLAALYLRVHPAPPQATVNMLSTMIRDSNNDAADTIFFALGGRGPVIAEMASVCGITGPYIPPGYWWASTWISARDVARLGACVAAGRVAGPEWTAWLLNEMRGVRGAGNFGIRLVFPEPMRGTIAIKNGWNIEDGVWYVNCLAIGDTWVLATESRAGSFVTGRDVCEGVTEQLLREPVGPLDIWSGDVPEQA